MRALFKLCLVAVLAVAIIGSCSGVENPVSGETGSPKDQPSLISYSSAGDSGHGHHLLAFYNVTVDENFKVTARPVRQPQKHWNVLKFLEQGPCYDCVKITGVTPSGNGTMLVSVELDHPFPTSALTGFDVRGICIFGGNHNFPTSGLVTSNRYSGEGELVNPDGFSTLYNINTEGSGPGGLEGYLHGKFAAPVEPNSTLNGYKRYISEDPGNTRNIFKAGESISVTYEIDMPDAPFGFGYAVDASWAKSTVLPVNDPITDFPPEANCDEPWKIIVSGDPIDQTGQTELTIDVYDWQSSDSHGLPVVECPELFDGEVTAVFDSVQTGFTRYTAAVQNLKTAIAGKYKCLISVEDNANAGSPVWLDLTAYQLFNIEVIPVQPDHHELWYYHSINLLPDQSLQNAIDMLQTAHDAGYTQVVLADFKLGTIDIQSQTYWDHVTEYVQAAENIGMEIIPSLVPVGYSDAVLCHDPNLIEGQPVVDCRFKVSGSAASVMQNPSTAVQNGGFEDHAGNNFPGWIIMDGEGVVNFADTSVKHSGSASIRFENFTSNQYGHGRIRQEISVEPWHHYGITFWMKTQVLQPSGGFNTIVFDGAFDKELEFLEYNVNSTQDWTEYHCVFNSQNNTTVNFYLGMWGGESGQMWIDDVFIENMGLINLIRRSGGPLTVTSADGSTVYTEGVDFEYVEDPLMGHAGSYTGTFDLHHTHPVITLLPGSSIQNGDELLVDYYHCTFIYDLQTACCLTDDDVFGIFDSTLSKVSELIDPTRVFIAVDELRTVNWCDGCQSTGKTPGQLLADATLRIDQIAHDIDPSWKLITWSDMYDPNHNAHDDYYLSNGTLSGSWDGLPQTWDIANWRQQNQPALDWFESLGNRQILCGYYDESGPDFSIDEWLDMSLNTDGVYAVMYTTWWKGYDNMAAWAQTVKDWDEANW